jgi:hypothetical protein
MEKNRGKRENLQTENNQIVCGFMTNILGRSRCRHEFLSHLVNENEEIVIRIINHLIELILISDKDLVNKVAQGQRHALRLAS